MATTINADTSDGLKLTADASGEIELQSSGVTQAKVTSSGLQNASGNPITSQAGKNIIINGNMQIAQRATSVTGITAQGYYTVDRWRQQLAGGGTYTQAQTALTSSNAPFADGFSQSIKYDCTTTYTGVDSFIVHRQVIEGQNLQQLAYGTSSAKSLTLSFWVKSNVTGTAIANLYSFDSNRQIGKTYTIDVANTWEYKTVTFAGDTSSSFDNDNTSSLNINFVMSVGTNYTSGTLQSTWTNYVNADFASGQTIDISASTSNQISFTGVQLEAGTVATPFENLQYTTQLQLCQRYYFVLCDGSIAARQSIGIGAYYSSSDLRGTFSFPTTMRATPTLEVETVTDGYDFRRVSGVDRVSSFTLLDASLTSVNFNNNTDASGTAGTAGELFSDDVSAFLAVSAEL